MKKQSNLKSSHCGTFTIESTSKAQIEEEENEDSILVDPSRGLAGVFDGVGGRGNGQRASRLGVQVIHAGWKIFFETVHSAESGGLEPILCELMKQADAQIASLAIPAGQMRPATTAALAAISFTEEGAVLTYAHVGDSRIYLLQKGQRLQRLTEDDGYLSFAVQKGRLAKEEAWCIDQATEGAALSKIDRQHFGKRNRITNALGWGELQEVHANSRNFIEGDRVLLCTDGIHDNLTDQEIEALLREKPSAEHLLQSAYQRSQQEHLRAKADDMSVVIITYQARL